MHDDGREGGDGGAGEGVLDGVPAAVLDGLTRHGLYRSFVSKCYKTYPVETAAWSQVNFPRDMSHVETPGKFIIHALQDGDGPPPPPKPQPKPSRLFVDPDTGEEFRL
ncbi:MAG: hypothetical protein WA431_11570 [Candidatus Cybelea sp.]